MAFYFYGRNTHFCKQGNRDCLAEGEPLAPGAPKAPCHLAADSACVTRQLERAVYLSFFQSCVDIFVLLVLFQLCFDQDLTNVHHLLHGQCQALHRVAELLQCCLTDWCLSIKGIHVLNVILWPLHLGLSPRKQGQGLLPPCLLLALPSTGTQQVGSGF